jgi:dTDP-glucose 4,6-dehydratase
MKIVVTGGLGFIGSNFIRYMLSNYSDCTIVNVDRVGIGANADSLRDVEKDRRYSFVKADICELDSFHTIFEKVGAVVHFAAETHVDRSIIDPNPFVQSNILGTFSLLEIERRLLNPIRHVQVSTDEVYGEIIRGTFKEESRLKPSNPYSASKAAADLLCQAYHRTYGLDVVITRCTNNYGPYQFPEKLIPKTIIRAQKNLPIPVYGSGKSIRDWIYVLDHCEAIDLVLRRGKAGEIYNVSSGNELSTMTIVKKILSALSMTEDLVTHVEERPGLDYRYSLDSKRIRSEIGWMPKHRFEIALENTVKWYVNNEWWWGPLINERILDLTPWRLI